MDAEIAEGETRERVLGQYEEGFGNVAPASIPAVDCRQQGTGLLLQSLTHMQMRSLTVI